MAIDVEFLKAVLEYEDVEEIEVTDDEILMYNPDMKFPATVTIQELYFKCKYWALKQGYVILSSIDSFNSGTALVYKDELEIMLGDFIEELCSIADTEINAVIISTKNIFNMLK